MTHPSVLILGTDAVLAAAPVTAVQLMHGCLRAGFDAVVPASWGDELIAARVIARIAAADGPVLQCSCPLVARRLAPNADVLAPMMFYSVAPPVATAHYVRALYAPSVVEITFAGACPSAADASVDHRITCLELLETLRARGVELEREPAEFDSVLPPDRRRFYSDPGGTPSRAALQRLAPGAEAVELEHGNFAVDLAQHLLSSSRILVSLAPALGCACAGMQPGVTHPEWRARVREQELPRALGPVVEHDLVADLEAVPDRSATRDEPASAPDGDGPTRESRSVAPAEPIESPALVSVESTVATDDGRRRSPSSPSRTVIGALPQSRSTGRQLPRAYVARRRSSPKGMRQSAIRRADPVMLERTTRWRRWAWIAAAGIGLLTLVRMVL